MKLVISYDIGDGCSWSSRVVEPCEYESAEAFIIHLEERIKEKLALVEKRNNTTRKPWVKDMSVEERQAYRDLNTAANGNVELAGLYFEYNYLTRWVTDDPHHKPHYEIDLPTVETLEEWFENTKPREIKNV